MCLHILSTFDIMSCNTFYVRIVLTILQIFMFKSRSVDIMGAGRKKKVVHDDDAPSIRSKKSRPRGKAKKDEVLADEREESEKDITGSESNVTQEIRTVTRGITHMDRLVVQRGKGLKKDIRFNKNGVPIGSDAAEMKSYIGVLARGKVNINYKSWKHVPKQIKELIWESVNVSKHQIFLFLEVFFSLCVSISDSFYDSDCFSWDITFLRGGRDHV